MELWDRTKMQEGGFHMPAWTNKDCLIIHRNLMVHWIMDPENKKREDVLEAAGLHGVIATGDIVSTSKHTSGDSTPNLESTIATRIKEENKRRKRKSGPQGKSPFTTPYQRKRATRAACKGRYIKIL